MKFRDKEQIREWINTQSFNTIIEGYVDLLWERQEKGCDKIVLTEEQFRQFFKIRGITEDGERERRGRKPKSLKDAV